LAKAKGYAARHQAQGDSTEHARARMEGPYADRQTGE
jgi:hypothetical protein